MLTALITGVSGQDGAYLAQFLLEKGYRVIGISRGLEGTSFENLKRLKIMERVELKIAEPTDAASMKRILSDLQPDEAYNLAGQSSVALSFERPRETFESNCLGVIHLLEAIRHHSPHTKLYNASSSECFGDTEGKPADEETPFSPRSPYGIAKAAAFWTVKNYRESYGLFACSGTLFNHESPFRSERFVTQKIILAAKRISTGEQKELYLGNIDIQRDWGWAPEYVTAMHKMLQQPVAQDFIIATGTSRPLRDFVNCAFQLKGLKYTDYIKMDESLKRKSELKVSRANVEKAKNLLGWSAKYHMEDVVRLMIEAESC